MRKKNIKLKVFLFEKGITYNELYKKTGIHINKISMIIHGSYIPTDIEIDKICDALEAKKDELF